MENISDGYGKIADLDKLRRTQEEDHAIIGDLSEDVTELIIFADDVANKFNLHGVDPPPKMQGKRNIRMNI